MTSSGSFVSSGSRDDEREVCSYENMFSDLEADRMVWNGNCVSKFTIPERTVLDR